MYRVTIYNTREIPPQNFIRKTDEVYTCNKEPELSRDVRTLAHTGIVSFTTKEGKKIQIMLADSDRITIIKEN